MADDLNDELDEGYRNHLKALIAGALA